MHFLVTTSKKVKTQLKLIQIIYFILPNVYEISFQLGISIKIMNEIFNTLFLCVFKIQGRTSQFSLVEFQVASDYYIGQCSPVGLVLNAVANSNV